MAQFPSADWLQSLMEKLNSDEKYAQVARNWEGDMAFHIEPGAKSGGPKMLYVDLWHGKCRDAFVADGNQQVKPAFVLKGPYANYVRLLKGEVDPIQALLTRKISVQGNMAVILRSVPTVLDFVRCCREVTDSFAE